MNHYAKDPQPHLDLPKEFQGNFPTKNRLSDIPWDFILLAITIFFLLQEDN